MGKNAAALLLLTTSLCGCNNAINVRHDFSADGEARAVFVDAKQRAVTIVPTQTATYTSDGKLTTATTTPLRICAEPSPDALTAISTAASANGNVKDKVNFAAAFQQAEAAASMGLRTQSITLMRDVLYRICEQYQSGALTPAGVETLERRYQSSMVAILAVEQLTGVVRAPAVNLGSNASNGSADSVAAIYKAKTQAESESTAADSKLETAEDELKAAQAELDTAKKDGNAHDDLEAKVTKATETRDEAKADADKKTQRLKDAATALAALGSGDGMAAATAAAEASRDHHVSDAQAGTIATAVQNIVSDTLQLGFLRETCATLFIAQIEGRTSLAPNGTDKNFADSCKSYFDETVKTLQASNSMQSAIATLISKSSGKKEDLEALAKLIAATNASGGVIPAQPAAPAAPLNVITFRHIAPPAVKVQSRAQVVTPPKKIDK